ncbi:uncharacterized protein LOC108679881 [Hyalella azteca]|uniref:Uncharacterized protein LOC108679881 n=1 Tax=Hyalella azteca TaxID=294128 RepID=A0A8B7PDD6_HYAAZ|nr:uncharacterized protein LOC108679881 [Hyalella azteca]
MAANKSAQNDSRKTGSNSHENADNLSCSSELPPHWILKQSRSRKGQIYYANCLTKEVTWELPNFEPCPEGCSKCLQYQKVVPKEIFLCKGKTNKLMTSIDTKSGSEKRKKSAIEKPDLDNFSPKSKKLKCQNLEDVNLKKEILPKAGGIQKNPILTKSSMKLDPKFGSPKFQNDSGHTSEASTANMKSISTKKFISSVKSENQDDGYTLHHINVMKSTNTLSGINSSSSPPKSKTFLHQCKPKIPKKQPFTTNIISEETSRNISERNLSESVGRTLDGLGKVLKVPQLCTSECKEIKNVNVLKLFCKKAKITELSQQPKDCQAVQTLLDPDTQWPITHQDETSSMISTEKHSTDEFPNEFVQSLPSKFGAITPDSSAIAVGITSNKKIFPQSIAEGIDAEKGGMARGTLFDNKPCKPIPLEDASCLSRFGQIELDVKSLTTCIVVDTNILIHNLSLLKSLSSNNIFMRGSEYHVLVVPYTALVELDGLKQQEALVARVRAAIKWCNKAFGPASAVAGESYSSIVQGQSYTNFKYLCETMGSKKGDDCIRDCCLWLQQQGFCVMLLSNDMNFRTKVHMANILCIDSTGMWNKLEWLNETRSSNSLQLFPVEKNQDIGSVKKNGDLNRQGQKREVLLRTQCKEVDASRDEDSVPSTDSVTNLGIIGRTEFWQTENMIMNFSSTNSDSLCPVQIPPREIICSSLKNTIENILKQIMQDVYDDLWLQIVFRKPPWTLDDLIVCWEKHWRAVLFDQFPNSVLKYLRRFKSLLANESTETKLFDSMSQIFLQFSLTKFSNLVEYPKELAYFNSSTSEFSSLLSSGETSDSSMTSFANQNNIEDVMLKDALAYSAAQLDSLNGGRPASASSVSAITSSESSIIYSTSHFVPNSITPSKFCPVLHSSEPEKDACASQFSHDTRHQDVSPVSLTIQDEANEQRAVDEILDSTILKVALDALTATGNKMRDLVLDGLSSLAAVEGPDRTRVLQSLLCLRDCIRSLREAIARCRLQPSAATHLTALRAAICSFWTNVPGEVSVPQVFSGPQGDLIAQALFVKQESEFWLNCINQLREMEVKLELAQEP